LLLTHFHQVWQNLYQINNFKTGDILINSGFTVAYCTISNEHYEGETPTSKEQPVSGSQPTPKSAPAFSL